MKYPKTLKSPSNGFLTIQALCQLQSQHKTKHCVVENIHLRTYLTNSMSYWALESEVATTRLLQFFLFLAQVLKESLNPTPASTNMNAQWHLFLDCILLHRTQPSRISSNTNFKIFASNLFSDCELRIIFGKRRKYHSFIRSVATPRSNRRYLRRPHLTTSPSQLYKFKYTIQHIQIQNILLLI